MERLERGKERKKEIVSLIEESKGLTRSRKEGKKKKGGGPRHFSRRKGGGRLRRKSGKKRRSSLFLEALPSIGKKKGK